MITNERQYRITRKKALGFVRAIEEFDAMADERNDVHARLLRAEREAMESQLADLRKELDEYEQLKSAHMSVISVASFEELADGPDQGQDCGRTEPAGACPTPGTQGAADPTV